MFLLQIEFYWYSITFFAILFIVDSVHRKQSPQTVPLIWLPEAKTWVSAYSLTSFRLLLLAGTCTLLKIALYLGGW